MERKENRRRKSSKKQVVKYSGGNIVQALLGVGNVATNAITRLPFPSTLRTWSRAQFYVKNATVAGVGTLSATRLNSYTSSFLYYTQLSALYNRYRVLRSHVSIWYTTNAGDSNMVVAVPINGTNSDTSTAALCLYPRAAIGSVVAYQPLKLSFKVNLADLSGVPSLEYAEADRFQSVFGSSPSEVQNLYHIWDNNFATADTVSAFITLDSELELMDLQMNL